MRCLQHDKFEGKFEGKIVEVDYEIPPKVGMTICTQYKIFRFSKIRANPLPQYKENPIRQIRVPNLSELFWATRLYPQSNLKPMW